MIQGTPSGYPWLTKRRNSWTSFIRRRFEWIGSSLNTCCQKDAIRALIIVKPQLAMCWKIPGAVQTALAPWIPWIPHNRGLGLHQINFYFVAAYKWAIGYCVNSDKPPLGLLNESSRLQHQLNKNFGIGQMLAGNSDTWKMRNKIQSSFVCSCNLQRESQDRDGIVHMCYDVSVITLCSSQ